MRNACFAAALALLAACSTTPTAQRTERAERPGHPSSLAEQAQADEQNGRLGAAESLYRQLAAQTTGSVSAGYLIRAARLEIQLNDTAGATARLGAAAENADAQQQQLIEVLRADIDTRSGKAAAALARLAQLPKQLPPEVLAEADRVRGAALFATNRPVDAVRALIERGTWLNTGPEILANQRLIWDGLAASPSAQSAEATGDPVIDGWLALAPIAASHAQGAELRRALLEWRRRYTHHPAAGGLLASLLEGQRSERGFPAQVALILPLSSPQRTAALAIRDGFLAERFSDANGSKTAVRVYDATALGAAQAYERAQLEGADFIVGPLLRPAVEQILPKAGLVPTLALNFVQNQAPPSAAQFPEDFYQFALAPEDEAREVARHAVAAGEKTALVLYPSTDRGKRVLNSFESELEELGGRVLGAASYTPGAEDFSTTIEVLLNLDRSDRRFRRLQANLGLPIEFQPRRRRDVDMIFIGADRTNGLLLAPALRFHFAGDIPTYATSVIFEPGAAGSDTDLDGIYFPDAPWLLTPTAESSKLRRTLASYWPERSLTDAQFYAMGADAYRLVGALFGRTENWPLAGASGELVLDDSGRIHREMPLAQFRKGQPVAVETNPPSQRLAGTQ